MDRFGELPDVASVLAHGETKMSVRTHKGLQIDLRVVPARSFGEGVRVPAARRSTTLCCGGEQNSKG